MFAIPAFLFYSKRKNLPVPVDKQTTRRCNQMHSHCINKLLNLEDVIIKKVSHSDTFVKIYIETKPKEHLCPCCGLATKRIHDYRSQTIKDLPFQMKHCYLVLRKRRYLCSFGKRFFENYSFLPRYFQRT